MVATASLASRWHGTRDRLSVVGGDFLPSARGRSGDKKTTPCNEQQKEAYHPRWQGDVM
jgi:hypothetical protein